MEKLIKKAAKFYRLFQALAIILANHRCGVHITKDFCPTPIFKYEGGGVINHRDVVIKYSSNDKIYCYDDINPNRVYEPRITEEVIIYLLKEFSWEEDKIQKEVEEKIPTELGITSVELFDIVQRFCSNPFLGDPMRSFFEVATKK